jgi:hypothetical protein
MLNQLAGYFHNLFNKFGKTQTYGSALEEYIVSRCPQNTGDIDRLTHQYQLSQEKNTGRLWL